ncbi:MAG: arsenosugar biosynthesis radical SAM (seleno)protein ArsS [Syntrophomonadaceae bacterium]|nr:arsenosugar biosynthesis radical SAM (seleno)protein ArsS [Syntrophomonadaceae bacterium]
MDQYKNDSVAQNQDLNNVPGITPFVDRIKGTSSYPLRNKGTINTLQVNVGKVCNLMCKHCHVEAGPHRTESMSRETMSRCIEIIRENTIPILDITGGAPELNPNLAWFIEEAGQTGCHIMVRTNLTALALPEHENMPEYYAGHNVELSASLPYYTEKDTDRQRGTGVFKSSIAILARLNELGYGCTNGRLKLNLVYNPGGAFLPPSQKALEVDYHRVLKQYGISFNEVYALTNVPVGRFLVFLNNSGNLQRYMQRLAGSFNDLTVGSLMCRDQISVGWDGQIYDCDFNQMLGLNCTCGHISDFSLEALKEREIVLGNHCYACTAGAGSSCGGAIQSA